MVSLRRRRLLGLCSGKGSMPIELSGSIESINVVENLSKNVNPFGIHPMSPVSLKHENPANVQEISISSSTLSTTSSTKEELNNCFLGKEVKRRKRHRRKHFDDQEPCIMRGVYFKNMKWQAAIKVDKKQIHLGTVGSQEEAARLYDRAAFMCGREPNFELSEDEQRELKQYSWDEFLTKTRNAISIKKHQKKTGGGRRKISAIEFHCSDIELERGASGSLSTSDDGEPEASAS
ncbi:Ethylene-responsive transcription factor-like protein [Apostasia shenzhenica]|uniref:Ethylene-responsive transcription factor-like protein n=1 Tax=Apostasia shenzhenica TaxID=1088818 RepID=A0A2I0AFX9_9ASPA|nr:Ethylene-responsive transcription factor-like protein [Apostasia shenzhenica]